MKTIKRTDEMLILRGYSWFRFAAAILFLLSTPFWIWLASVMPLMEPVFSGHTRPEPMRRFVLVCLAAVFPLITYIWVRKTYTNWQLILESDYDRAAIYSGMWGTRQRGRVFPLANIERAKRITRKIHETNSWGREIVTHEHSLVLITSSSGVPIHIGRGSANDIYRMVTVIDGWIKNHHKRAPQASGEALDSRGVPA